jgi:hypothetical protein
MKRGGVGEGEERHQPEVVVPGALFEFRAFASRKVFASTNARCSRDSSLRNWISVLSSSNCRS